MSANESELPDASEDAELDTARPYVTVTPTGNGTVRARAGWLAGGEWLEISVDAVVPPGRAQDRLLRRTQGLVFEGSIGGLVSGLGTALGEFHAEVVGIGVEPDEQHLQTECELVNRCLHILDGV